MSIMTLLVTIGHLTPHSPKFISEVVHALIKLREDGVIDEKQFISLLKYSLANFVERKITEKVNSALDKSIGKSILDLSLS